MRSITDPALVPPVRHAYHLSLFEHGATDGEELQCATQDEPQANHTLSDYPEEMVLTLLVCDTTQWPQMLDKMSEVQLKRRDVGSAEMLTLHFFNMVVFEKHILCEEALSPWVIPSHEMGQQVLVRGTWAFRTP